MFYQDRYFVRLQVAGATSLEKDIFLTCARAISGKPPGGFWSAQRAGDFEDSGACAEERTVSCAKAFWGMSSFARELSLMPQRKTKRCRFFVIHEDTQAAARKTFDQYHSYLKSEGQGIQMTGNPARMQVIPSILCMRSVSRAVGTPISSRSQG